MAEKLTVPTMAELSAKGEKPEILFWVGCAGSFDDRAKKITRALVRILNHVGINFAVLGTEESCTGDPAKRTGNEFLFQMQAVGNIEVLNSYGVEKIVTTCPHCFNTLKNEYPELGGHYEVVHHSQLINDLIREGKIAVKDGGTFKGKRITFHDPCYLGRGNDVFEAPRELLQSMDAELVEMGRCKQNGFCCGAGGGQMFKDAERGNKEVNVERTEEALETNAGIVATGCPFCNTMMTDGVKNKDREGDVQVMDLAELVAQASDL